MKLLLDVGNARVKWAWLAAGELTDPGALGHAGASTREILKAIGKPAAPVKAVRMCSVGPPGLTASLVEALGDAFGVPVSEAHTQAAAAGVRNGYREHRQLGVDRWLAILAAYNRHHAPVCVIDAGTAWTVDAVAADGRHLGGLIIPGPPLMRRALLAETGGIGAAVQLAPGRGSSGPDWGRDTESGIRNGTRAAASGLVEACARGFSAPPATVVLTGGDAPALLAGLALPVEHRPLLVLEGLALSGAWSET